jgi:hypothetical protein
LDRVSLIKKMLGYGSDLGWSDSGWSDSDRIEFRVEHCCVFLGFGLFWVGFRILSSSSHFEFQVIRVRVESRSGRISDHMIPDCFEFRIVSDWVGSSSFLWCYISVRARFRVGLNFRSSYLKTFFHKFILVNVRYKLSIMLWSIWL